tara:strand:+ start:266 stop:466 length:201 start_codon:yes stop_codon:yes gene_type:complete
MNLVLKHIKFLAEDTSLVALNSSIGADRAGASGKRFDVVPMRQKFCRIAQISSDKLMFTRANDISM